jgi:hypothetical protein
VIGKFFVLAAFSAVLTGCGGEDPPTSPAGNNVPNGTFTALIDGIGYRPVIAVVSITEQAMQITTTNVLGVSTFSISMLGTGVGTYVIGPNTAHSAVHGFPNGSAWLANQAVGTGTISVTTFSESRIAGTFEFMMAAAPGNSVLAPKRVTLGIFDLTYTSEGGSP